MKALKALLNALGGRRVLRRLGFEIINCSELAKFYRNTIMKDALVRWANPLIPPELSHFVLSRLVLSQSPSQLQQDLVALFVNSHSTEQKRYYVEFGATNGFSYSNTYILEKYYGYDGVLAEPAISCRSELEELRTARLDSRCVWHTSGDTILFEETLEPEYSSISGIEFSEGLSKQRKNPKKYLVNTISLNDLLIDHQAPSVISYLSIDTEGSELQILEALNFENWIFEFISVEHNYSQNRDKLNALLTSKGYVNFLPQVSDFDDWYIHKTIWKRFSPIFIGTIKHNFED